MKEIIIVLCIMVIGLLIGQACNPDLDAEIRARAAETGNGVLGVYKTLED